MLFEKVNLKQAFPQLESEEACLEVYVPENLYKGNMRPSLLICPGGGYAFCSRREAEAVAVEYLPENFNVFVLTYSTENVKFPTQLIDVAAAMELIYQNKEKWCCDTEKIAIMGFSAGGHLAAHYSTMFDCSEVRHLFPQSKAVNASVLCYPVITADEKYSHSGSFKNLLGHYPLSEEEMNRFSIERCVKENTPPAFIWHNAGDDGVPMTNSLLYAQALSDKKIPFELHIFPKGCHGLSTCDNRTNGELTPDVVHSAQWIELSKKWLKLTFQL